jgi:hypothetical protein
MKTFYTQDNIGRAKYTVSYHDGESKYKDGSKFFDMAIFKNKKKRDAFVLGLVSKGYTEKHFTI